MDASSSLTTVFQKTGPLEYVQMFGDGLPRHGRRFG